MALERVFSKESNDILRFHFLQIPGIHSTCKNIIRSTLPFNIMNSKHLFYNFIAPINRHRNTVYGKHANLCLILPLISLISLTIDILPLITDVLWILYFSTISVNLFYICCFTKLPHGITQYVGNLITQFPICTLQSRVV